MWLHFECRGKVITRLNRQGMSKHNSNLFIGHGQISLKVPNVKVNFDGKFSLYALGTACCQQIQIHQKRNILIFACYDKDSKFWS